VPPPLWGLAMTQAPTSRTSFDNPTTQEQRARILEDERRTNTRAAMQAMLDPSLGGRFAKEVKADFTVGNSPRVEYPRLPSGPWGNGPQVPDEPALGFSVNDLEPTGETFEVEHSVETAPAASPPGQRTDADPSPQIPGSDTSAGSSLPSAPQLPDVAAATARPFSNSWRRFG
jgi:hypothetical protein